jgi:predicted small lipoprotein YifL
LTCHSLFKTALLAAALSGALLLAGCGRRGPPVPIDSTAAQTPADKNNPNAPPKKNLPTGLDSKSLKAGAPTTPTPFDFLL